MPGGKSSADAARKALTFPTRSCKIKGEIDPPSAAVYRRSSNRMTDRTAFLALDRIG